MGTLPNLKNDKSRNSLSHTFVGINTHHCIIVSGTAFTGQNMVLWCSPSSKYVDCKNHIYLVLSQIMVVSIVVIPCYTHQTSPQLGRNPPCWPGTSRVDQCAAATLPSTGCASRGARRTRWGWTGRRRSAAMCLGNLEKEVMTTDYYYCYYHYFYFYYYYYYYYYDYYYYYY